MPTPDPEKPDYHVTIFVFFDPERLRRTHLLFSPGPDIIAPAGASVMVRWVGIQPDKSDHAPPTLDATASKANAEDAADATRVKMVSAGTIGGLRADVKNEKRSGVVTINVAATNGQDAQGRPVQIMGDSTIRNKGGSGVPFTTIGGGRIGWLVVGILLAAFFVAGALMTYLSFSSIHAASQNGLEKVS